MGGPFSKGQVRAIFRDSILQLEIAAGTTLEHLCSLLTSWGKGHGQAIRVEVTWLPVRSDEVGRNPVGFFPTLSRASRDVLPWPERPATENEK
jgi:hypothetical protein